MLHFYLLKVFNVVDLAEKCLRHCKFASWQPG